MNSPVLWLSKTDFLAGFKRRVTCFQFFRLISCLIIFLCIRFMSRHHHHLAFFLNFERWNWFLSFAEIKLNFSFFRLRLGFPKRIGLLSCWLVLCAFRGNQCFINFNLNVDIFLWKLTKLLLCHFLQRQQFDLLQIGNYIQLVLGSLIEIFDN